MKKYPVSLDKDPILESLFEIRFQRKDIPTPEILPGIIFARCKERFNLTRIERFSIPEELISREENLKYVPQVKIKGKNYGIQIADSAVSLSRLKPYCGWHEFKEAILFFLEALVEQKEIIFSKLVRFSLKYVNLFKNRYDISPLKLKIEIDQEKITSEKVFLTIERDLENDKLIIHINNQFKLFFEDTLLEGLLLAIDIIRFIDEENVERGFHLIKEALEEMHSKEKQFFFSLIADELLKEMGPKYD